MLKRLAFVLVVCSCVGIAYGAAVKIKSFVNINEPNPEADGMAILNYVSGQDRTIIQIMVSDFTPNETYDLRITNGIIKLDGDDVFTTDQHGHATYHGTYFFDKSTWDMELYVDDDHDDKDGDGRFFDPSELRAIGLNPGA